MAGAFTSLLYHIIFSSKNRKGVLHGVFQNRMYQFLGGIIREKEGKVWAIGGFPDHVHLLFSFNPNESPSEIVRILKCNSSKWARETFPAHEWPGWQRGYAAFTVSLSKADDVKQYIENQGEHHRAKTFQEELLAFLEKHGVEYDEKYLWQ